MVMQIHLPSHYIISGGKLKVLIISEAEKASLEGGERAWNAWEECDEIHKLFL